MYCFLAALSADPRVYLAYGCVRASVALHSHVRAAMARMKRKMHVLGSRSHSGRHGRIHSSCVCRLPSHQNYNGLWVRSSYLLSPFRAHKFHRVKGNCGALYIYKCACECVDGCICMWYYISLPMADLLCLNGNGNVFCAWCSSRKCCVCVQAHMLIFHRFEHLYANIVVSIVLLCITRLVDGHHTSKGKVYHCIHGHSALCFMSCAAVSLLYSAEYVIVCGRIHTNVGADGKAHWMNRTC